MVKKITLSLLLGMSCFASQQYTKADRIKDMQTMAQAMNEIETGFFYNNKDAVTQGALKLSDAIRNVRPPLEEKEEKNPMTRYMNEKVKFSNKIVKKIDKKSELIIQRFNNGDTSQALQAYKKIMSSCMECHSKLRRW